jgi:hypothetical protein
MSITTRIRLVGAVATAVAVAVAVFGLWASVGDLPGILSPGPAGALVGMLVATSCCVALALSLEASQRRMALEPEATPPLHPRTSYQFPPA